MRTTIDISDEHRAALLALAAKRGVSGYSQIIKEALASIFLTIKAQRIQEKYAKDERFLG